MDVSHIFEENAKNLTVLFIESHAGTRLTLSKILKKYFKVVNVCAYADDAIIAFKSSSYDLIITESHLPDVDTCFICNFINSITTTKHIIVISNTTDVNELIEFINIGISGFVKTPIDKSSFLELLSNVVNKIADRKLLYEFLDVNIYPKQTQSDFDSVMPNKEVSLIESVDSMCMDTNHMSAKELINAYPLNLETVGDKLLILNDKLDIYISRFIHDSSSLNALDVASVFEAYFFTLRDMDFFSNIALSTKKLSELFKNLDPNKSYNNYSDLLYAISVSLCKWCDEIFISQTSPDIYFMDKSILADVITIEHAFSENEEAAEEIEFF